MKKIFRAAKMIARIKAEGRRDMLDAETLKFINELDGKTGNDYNWQSVVNGAPLVYLDGEAGEDGVYVNVNDCDDAE